MQTQNLVHGFCLPKMGPWSGTKFVPRKDILQTPVILKDSWGSVVSHSSDLLFPICLYRFRQGVPDQSVFAHDRENIRLMQASDTVHNDLLFALLRA